MTVGEDKVVDVTDVEPAEQNGIMIGNPGIVATSLIRQGDARQILFKPLKAGETNISIRDAEGNLKIIFIARIITATPLDRTASQLRELLKDIEGIHIKIVGKKIVIDGEVLVPADYGRIGIVIGDKSAGFGADVLNLVTLSAYAMQLLSKRIQQDVNTFAPNVKTRVVNGQIWLEGTVDNFDQARRAQIVAQLYLPEALPPDPVARVEAEPKKAPQRGMVHNFIVINPPPPKKEEKLVRVTIHFVELSKDYIKTFGFKWQPGIAADPQVTVNSQQGTGGGGASLTATLSNLLPQLQNAQNAGYARILKTGTVIVRSGQPAKLEEKTYIPYTMVGANGQVTSQVAPVGLQVGVTPAILGTSEDIQMEMKMSQINLTGRVGNTPITAEHAVETRIYVKSGESAALAGVSSSDIKTEFNRDAGDQGNFQRDPSGGQGSKALINLLRSKNYNKKKSQFVIFVTPQIISNASDGTQDLKKNFRVKAEVK